ncbi:unnamed protein product [Vicia faba]|uniref:RING-CH-type domain-containing protein n=1 Tax=Vicia faba TaxID=3906 RepID=A0AAV0ZCM1_VICFA|nr:unnamed protein product [Vicia faba]
MVDQIESCSPNTLVQCRICHDEDEDLNMDTPCSCSGTLQYAHRICVQRWCNEKGDTTCEIFQQQFKGYTAPQAPLFHYRGNWEIPRVGFNNHQFIALFPANHEFLDFNFEYSAPSTRSRVFIRIVAIISGNNISEKAYEDGRTMVESKTADLRSQIRRKGDTNQASSIRNPWQQSDQTQSHSNHETQLKQSRDVALATAAKAKLLLRELKTVKADLAFAKARCAQLEEENKLLREREGSDKGLIRDDDDLVLINYDAKPSFTQILVISSIGLIFFIALRYHLKKIRDQKIITRLRLSRAGHPPKLERFSHYIARKMGFKDRRIGPDICRLASEYISKYEGFEDDIYAYFENEPDADSLYVKLVEEFERCILSYFGFHWNHCDILISQVLSSDISEPKKKLKNIVMAATRDQRFERFAKSLKVASVFNTLVEEMKAMGIAVNDDSQCTHSDRSPVLLLMGGGMGAGKSTVLKDILKEPFWAGASGNSVVIEADAFKESDVIYRALRSTGHHDMIRTAELAERKNTAFVDVSPEETVQKNAFERFKDVDESSSFKEARALAEASQNGAPFNQGFGNSPGSLSARKIEESEAQCALLNSESLCDGCFSSDSDIFLFGARTVYREIFLGDGGYVVCYEMAEIENKLGLGRDSLIALSLLLGSDYHQGVHGLGPELACQIVKSIGEKDVLKKFASEGLRWVKKRKGAKNNIGKDDTILQVIDAYLKPKCHSADSDFVLKAHSQYPFQRTKLHHICTVYFEWPSERTDGYILPCIAERDLRRFSNLRSTSSELGLNLPLHEGLESPADGRRSSESSYRIGDNGTSGGTN